MPLSKSQGNASTVANLRETACVRACACAWACGRAGGCASCEPRMFACFFQQLLSRMCQQGGSEPCIIHFPTTTVISLMHLAGEKDTLLGFEICTNMCARARLHVCVCETLMPTPLVYEGREFADEICEAERASHNKLWAKRSS